MKTWAAMVWAVGLLATAGCLESAAVECAWGMYCPPGYLCEERSQSCVLQAQLDACEGLANGQTCAYGPDDQGVCDQGVCLPVICGRGDRTRYL